VDPAIVEYHSGSYTVSTDRSRLDVTLIHDFLAHRSYWAQGIDRDVVTRAIDHSLPFGVYAGQQQVGFARVLTDYAVFAYLMDVFILESHRGQGLGKWLVACIIGHPALQGLRRWMLATHDAHGLYRRYGFAPLEQPAHYLATSRPHLPTE
jgi:ribosomal protein S18 acetylase RimI-like enzyme